MNSPQHLELLVSLKDIADLTEMKSSAAVSNWRRRHEDFPAPRLETPAGALFDFEEIQDWLLATKRIPLPIPPAKLLWNLAGSLRRWWEPAQIVRIIIALLVYLEAGDRDNEIRVDAESKWESVSKLEERVLIPRLVKAALDIESENPQLRWLMLPTLKAANDVPSQSFVNLIRILETSAVEKGSRATLLEAALTWKDQSSRFLAETSTPKEIQNLLAEIAARRGRVVLDPAVGEGGLLRMVSTISHREGVEHAYLGFEGHRETLEICRAGFFLLGTDAELHIADSLNEHDPLGVQADLVVCHPPYGVSGWANANAARDPRWVFGIPSPNSSDFAWMQTVVQSLRPGGVGLILLPKSSASVEGRDGAIRQAMLKAGAIVGCVLLPGWIQRNISNSPILWVLKRPEEGTPPASKVLLVDASTMEHHGRGENRSANREIMALAHVVNAFLDGQPLSHEHSFVHRLLDASEVPNGNILRAILRIERKGMHDSASLEARRDELKILLANSVRSASIAMNELLRTLKESR